MVCIRNRKTGNPAINMNQKIRYTPKKNNETVLREKDGIPLITFTALDQYQDRLVNAFSTRAGGCSTGFRSSMNLGFANGDDPETVRKNYRIFTEALGIRSEDIVITDQKHTANIQIVTAEDRGKGLLKNRDYEAIDGFVTNEPNTALCILVADCVPVYLYDPVKHAIGLVHSGWKGTAGKISAGAVARMKEAYGSSPADIIACIGPSICADCYEVSDDLLPAFSETFSEEEIRQFFGQGNDESHFQLDLWKAVRMTLGQAGLKVENIHNTDLCTCHNPELLFSHRFTKGKRGNMAALLMLRSRFR